MNIQDAVRNAYHAAQEMGGRDVPSLREVWLWLPTISANRIAEVLFALGLRTGIQAGRQ